MFAFSNSSYCSIVTEEDLSMHDKIIKRLSVPKVRQADLARALYEDEGFLRNRHLPCPMGIALHKHLLEILVLPSFQKSLHN